ncbi:MAG: ABC transporter ATP-binding protein [Candidatus Omnitrophica bacterium]|nr:ABC transporter ATP-binding protein [Candidatus Omnitrophota bacterium]MCM8826089.1 ABC transporter ATP-binding protein [Candidatus Omnitrophota bacterium]
MELLRTENIKKYFKIKKRTVKALDGVDISIYEKLTTGLVGESGCGKTTLAKAILGFYSIDSGKIYFKGEEINLRNKEKFIRRNIQIVFQNPYLSFDPRYTMFSTLYETLNVWEGVSKDKAIKIIEERLEEVELDKDTLYHYPHQLSGGQLQRFSLLRALINKPRLVVLDEPTSNLDISTTFTILKLLNSLQRSYSLSYLFISHNLNIVKKVSSYVFVMYGGKIVEAGLTERVYNNPMHPYTKLLISAASYKLKDVRYWGEEVGGCVFRNYCCQKRKVCYNEPSKLQVEQGHWVYCHLIQYMIK